LPSPLAISIRLHVSQVIDLRNPKSYPGSMWKTCSCGHVEFLIYCPYTLSITSGSDPVVLHNKEPTASPATMYRLPPFPPLCFRPACSMCTVMRYIDSIIERHFRRRQNTVTDSGRGVLSQIRNKGTNSSAWCILLRSQCRCANLHNCQRFRFGYY